jgi:hypothetical protein
MTAFRDREPRVLDGKRMETVKKLRLRNTTQFIIIDGFKKACEKAKQRYGMDRARSLILISPSKSWR